MIRIYFIAVGIAILSCLNGCAPTIQRADEATAIPEPSPTVASGYFHIFNDTEGEITFYLVTDEYRAEYLLPSKARNIFIEDSDEVLMEIHSGSENIAVFRSLTSGKRYYIDWAGGVLDVFEMPPN